MEEEETSGTFFDPVEHARLKDLKLHNDKVRFLMRYLI